MLFTRVPPSRSKPPLRFSTSGFGLVEALIVAAAVSLLTVGVFTFYSSVSAKTKAHETTQAVLELRQSIHKAYVASANFSGVTNASVLAENLLPTGLEVAGPPSGPEFIAPYGGTVLVAAATVDGVPARGLGLTLNQVPRKLCPQIVASLAVANFQNITVNDSSVLGANGVLQQNLLAQLCAASGESTIALTVTDKQTDAALELGNCTAPTPSTETVVEACPAGYAGSITRKRSAACAPGSLLAEWGPWNEINTCQPVCAPDPASPQTRTSTPCPEGHIGSITEMRVSACATGQITGAPSWSDWTEVSNTCAPQCVVPADETKVENCPTGQVGQIYSRRSAHCPQATGSHEWGQWAEVSKTCEPACVVPDATTETRTANCPAGYAGRVTEARTTTWACPAATGSPTSTTGAWAQVSSTCQACPSPENEQEEDWRSRSQSCPYGWVGSHTWLEMRRRTRQVSYACPEGTLTVPSPTYGGWSGWTWTGIIAQEYYSCAAPSCQEGQFSPDGGTRTAVNNGSYGCSQAPAYGSVQTRRTTIYKTGQLCQGGRWINSEKYQSSTEVVVGGTNPSCPEAYWY